MATRANITPSPSSISETDTLENIEGIAPLMQGPDGMLKNLISLWKQHDRFEEAYKGFAIAGRLAEAEIVQEKSDAAMRRILMLEKTAIAFAFHQAPITPADGLAHLILIHAEIRDYLEGHEDKECRLLAGVMSESVRALAAIARGIGFDLEPAADVYMSRYEQKIIRGEVQP